MEIKATDHAVVSARVEILEKAGAAVEVLGTSLLGTPIPLVTLGTGRRAVLYVGAHHGMEGITAGVLLDFADDLLRAAAQGATVAGIEARYLLAERRIYVVPMLNPDGVAYAVHGVAPEAALQDPSSGCGA